MAHPNPANFRGLDGDDDDWQEEARLVDLLEGVNLVEPDDFDEAARLLGFEHQIDVPNQNHSIPSINEEDNQNVSDESALTDAYILALLVAQFAPSLSSLLNQIDLSNNVNIASTGAVDANPDAGIEQENSDNGGNETPLDDNQTGDQTNDNQH